jgi:hypothetical protein
MVKKNDRLSFFYRHENSTMFSLLGAASCVVVPQNIKGGEDFHLRDTQFGTPHCSHGVCTCVKLNADVQSNVTLQAKANPAHPALMSSKAQSVKAAGSKK